MGLATYDIDGLWVAVSTLKAHRSLSTGDAYALAAAKEIDDSGENDDVFETDDEYNHLIERFRDVSV